MYTYITCSCGRSLGDYYDAFKLIRQKKVAKFMENTPMKNLNIRPDMIMIGNDIKISLEQELDDLGFTMDCCRMKLSGVVEFNELY